VCLIKSSLSLVCFLQHDNSAHVEQFTSICKVLTGCLAYSMFLQSNTKLSFSSVWPRIRSCCIIVLARMILLSQMPIQSLHFCLRNFALLHSSNLFINSHVLDSQDTKVKPRISEYQNATCPSQPPYTGKLYDI